MIEIIHDYRMSLRDSAIRHFIIHKGTIILLSHTLIYAPLYITTNIFTFALSDNTVYKVMLSG